MLLHNDRTTKLLQAWVAPPSPGSNYLSDQDWLFSMDGRAFQLCSNAEECERVQTSSGLAAIHPFTSQVRAGHLRCIFGTALMHRSLHRSLSCQIGDVSGNAMSLLNMLFSTLCTAQYNKSSWTGHCPGRRPWPACAPYTLFMHIICHSGLRNKVG